MALMFTLLIHQGIVAVINVYGGTLFSTSWTPLYSVAEAEKLTCDGLTIKTMFSVGFTRPIRKCESSSLPFYEEFGLSDFVKTDADQRMNDIVGSAYYVAPKVLHRSYNKEADMWSIGVIIYILLCGSRPFFAKTESAIFRSVVKAEPNFIGTPWPSVSLEAKDFVKRLLNKDHRKRMTASQALNQRPNDIVGCAYYVAPEVLHRSYNKEADMWTSATVLVQHFVGSAYYVSILVVGCLAESKRVALHQKI
ncbi:CDPK-related kinase 4-like protein isoform X2 [Tanacetum coccineum]